MSGDEWSTPTRYPGRCVSCGADVPARRGDYRRGASGRWEVRHAAGKCPEPTRPKEPTAGWSDEEIRAEAERQGREVVNAETVCRSQRIGSRRMGPDMSTAPRPGSVSRKRGKMWMVVSVGKPYWMNRDDLDDMDMYLEEPGWYVDFESIEVTETPTERAEREVEEAERRAKEEAAKRAKEEAERRWHEIMSPPEGWTMLDGPLVPFAVTIETPEGTEVTVEDTVTVPPRDQWVLKDEIERRTKEGDLLRYADRYSAGPFEVLQYSRLGAELIAIMIPPHLVDEYMRAEAKRRGVTPAAAREWLAKYRGCVGTALYEWVAAHGEEAEGRR